MSNIVIFGIGRGASVATRFLRDDSPHKIVAYTVDDAYASMERFMDRPVIPFSRIESEIPPGDSQMFVPLGFHKMNAVRAERFAGAKKKGYSLASYISSRILGCERPKCGENCFILEGNTFNYDATVGDDVVMWSGNHVGDLSVIEDHVYLTSQVVLTCEVTIGAYSFLGAHATIAPQVRVGAGCYIGANSLITQDTAPGGVYITKSTSRLENIEGARFLELITN